MTSDGKVTAGPWRAIGGGPSIGIYSDFDGHAPIGDPTHVASLFQPHKVGDKDMYADAALIIAAVNACFQVSKENPKAVAEAIPDAFGILHDCVATVLRDEHVPSHSIVGRARALLSRLGIEGKK